MPWARPGHLGHFRDQGCAHFQHAVVIARFAQGGVIEAGQIGVAARKQAFTQIEQVHAGARQ